jgi:hypothetical protein
VYFNQQGFEKILWWIFAVNALELSSAEPEARAKQLQELQQTLSQVQQKAANVGYQVEKMLEPDAKSTTARKPVTR